MKKFIQHLNYRHGITPFQKVNIRCGQDDCQRSFDSVQSLRTHLHRFHSKPKFHNMGIDSTENLISDNGNDSLMSDQCETNDEDISTFASKTNDVDFSQLIFDFVLRLRSRNINQSTVDYVVNGLEYLLGTQFEIIKQKLEPVIHSNWSSPVTDLLSELEESLSSFNIVRTDYRQKKYLKEKCGLIEPEEVLLGTRCEQYLDKDKISSLKYVPETLQYMSVKKTIKNVLSAFSKEFENNALSEKTGIMKDYRDGEQLKKHSLFNKEPNALQLQMYFDEFETVNPLGSKTKVHKVGGLYMTVKNLPTQINSKLVNIHPIIYCHSQDIKKYGFKTIFSRVLDDQIKAAITWNDMKFGHVSDESVIGVGYADIPSMLEIPDHVFVNASIPLYEEVYVSSTVEIKGVNYTVSHVLPVSFERGHIQFAVIHQIISIPYQEDILFVMNKLCTHHFDSHFHAYAVTLLSKEQYICRAKDFLDYHPLHLSESYREYDAYSYVVLKYAVLDEDEFQKSYHQ